MREFVSVEGLARHWRVDEAQVMAAVQAARVKVYDLNGRAHVDRTDLLRLGDGLFRDLPSVSLG